MPREIATEQPAIEVCRYLRRWAHREFVEEEIQRRHAGLSQDVRARKARDAAASIVQGLELVETARSSSILTKPLALFYATEALAKAVAIVADAGLEGTSFRAHGLRGVRERRYFVRTLACGVQNPWQDVWSRLCATANTDVLRYSYTRDGTPETADDFETHSQTPVRPGNLIVLGDLLRQLPELAEDIPLAGMSHPYVVHVSQYQVRWTSSSQTVQANFMFRHANNDATKQMIVEHESARGALHQFSKIRDVLDVLEYRATTQADDLFIPERRMDIFGRLYMNFLRTQSYLAELPLYYAALFILSDAARYQGQWQKLLGDHPEEEVLIDRFLDVATRKLPNLALNHLTRSFNLFATV
jgi:hypothetical protein